MDDKFFYGYKLNVSLSEDQIRINTQLQEMAGKIQRQVINLREAMTRQALIKAGWTPPDLMPAESKTLYKCTCCGHLYPEKVSACDNLPQGQKQTFEEWTAYPKESTPSLLQGVLRCRYPVDISIRSQGHDWDLPRLDEVIDDAIKGNL